MSSQIEKIGTVTSKSVEKHTGKSWAEWMPILEKAGARNWIHKDIAAYLHKRHKLSLWWVHIVATGFEVHIGRKMPGRNLKGEYQITVTKTIHADGKKVWKYITSPKGIALWLAPMSAFKLKAKSTFEREDGVFGEIRTMKAPVRIRLVWREGDEGRPTVVQVMVVHRKNGTSILCFQHEKLMDGRLKETLRKHWRGVLEKICAAVE